MRYPSWRTALQATLFVLACSGVQAAHPGNAPARPADPGAAETRAVADGPHGQTGYVHYFLITHPDGTLEDQVGIELEDRRIAWSFPGAGVIVSSFIHNGPLEISGRTFFIEHLHGIPPFRTSDEMQALRDDLARRVAFWIDEETPYCIFRQPGERFCLNCGDFVARILFPATNTLMLGLPDEFIRTLGIMPSTDDLLIYMLGLHTLPDAQSRLDRLAALDLPDSLRLDVIAMLQPETGLLPQATTPSAVTADAPQVKKRGPRIAIRRTQSRRL